MVAIGLAIAVASATQDIAVDALRIEQIGRDEGEAMAAGAAVAVVGWWTGYKLGGVVALEAAQYFEQAGVEHYWQATFLVLGILVVLCNVGLAFVPEPSAAARVAAQERDEQAIASRLGVPGPAGRVSPGSPEPCRAADELLQAERRRHRRRRARLIFLFKIGEAFMGRMSLIFYKEVGFSKSDIAVYSKGLGWLTTLVFTVLGGLFAIRIGLIKAMFVSGIAMAATNLLFALMAWSRQVGAPVRDRRRHGRPHQRVRHRHLRRLHLDAGGPDLHRDPVCAARLHRHGRADDLRSLLGRTGDWLEGDWGTFFVITTLMVLPSLVCLWAIRNRLADLLAGARVRLFGKEADAAA